MNSNNQDLKNITKESITQALLRLMQEKEYKDISITDVCKLAGVSRNAFYRNYPAKDAILRQYMYEFTDVWRRQLRTVKNLTAKQYFTTLFEETGKHKELIRMLHKAQIESQLYSAHEPNTLPPMPLCGKHPLHHRPLDHERTARNARRARPYGVQLQSSFPEHAHQPARAHPHRTTHDDQHLHLPQLNFAPKKAPPKRSLFVCNKVISDEGIGGIMSNNITLLTMRICLSYSAGVNTVSVGSPVVPSVPVITKETTSPFSTVAS